MAKDVHQSMLFFFNDTATTEIYTLSLHDALPIYCAAEKLRALRARQTNRTHVARRTEVSPAKTSDCEGGCVCFKRVSMLAREGKAPRRGADTTRLGTA